MNIKAIAAITSILLVFGCATRAPTGEDVRPIPADQVFIKSIQATNETAKVIFVRDVGALGSLNYIHLFIDGKTAASFNTGDKLEINLPSGEHVFEVKPTDPFGLSQMYSMLQDLKPGKTYRYRLTITPNGTRIMPQFTYPKD